MIRTKSTSIILVMILGLTIVGCEKEAEEKTKVEESAKTGLDFTNEDTKLAYTIGNNFGRNLQANIKYLNELEIELSREILTQGFIDGLAEKSDLDDEVLAAVMKQFESRVRTLADAKQKQLVEEAKAKTSAYLKENSEKEGVITLPSGLQYKVITEGKGKKPGPTDKVKVHYSGTLTDGTKFDSSYDRNQPATFVVSGVIAGWTEALQLMKEGSKWQLTIPGNLAYGEAGRPGKIPANATLLFDVELLAINPGVEAPKEQKKADK